METGVVDNTIEMSFENATCLSSILNNGQNMNSSRQSSKKQDTKKKIKQFKRVFKNLEVRSNA